MIFGLLVLPPVQAVGWLLLDAALFLVGSRERQQAPFLSALRLFRMPPVQPRSRILCANRPARIEEVRCWNS